jgi:hypothetical protein
MYNCLLLKYSERLGACSGNELATFWHKKLGSLGLRLYCPGFSALNWLSGLYCGVEVLRRCGNNCICTLQGKIRPCHRRFVAGLSLRRPWFDPGSVHVGFVVDRVALRQVFLRVVGFFLSISFHWCSINCKTW